MLCLNAPELDTSFLIDLVAKESPQLQFVRRLDNPMSFPSSDPDRALKVLLFQIKQHLQSLHRLLTRLSIFLGPQLGHGVMENLVHNAARQGLNDAAVLVRNFMYSLPSCRV